MRLRGTNVVITGASSGIGAATAAAVAARGATVVLAARRESPLHEVASTLRSSGTEAHVHPCDVTCPEQLDHLITSTVDRLGHLDVLVNNAGISAYGDTERTRDSDFDYLLSVNLLGPWHAMRRVIPIMRRQGAGVIVNVTSAAALYGVPYLGAYGAAKAGLATLSQSLRAELAPAGIRVMVVYPGYTNTRIFDRERRLGGARRPIGPYQPADRVGYAIARGIERGRHELVVCPDGRGLMLVKRFLPAISDMIMRRMAARLRLPMEVTHVQA